MSSSTGACPLGAAEGKKNWFYLLARRAQHGDPEMAWHKMDAFDAVAAGVLKAQEIEAVQGKPLGCEMLEWTSIRLMQGAQYYWPLTAEGLPKVRSVPRVVGRLPLVNPIEWDAVKADLERFT